MDAALSLYWNFLKSQKQANSDTNEESMPKTGITSSCGAGALAHDNECVPIAVEESRLPAAHVEERPFMAA